MVFRGRRGRWPLAALAGLVLVGIGVLAGLWIGRARWPGPAEERTARREPPAPEAPEPQTKPRQQLAIRVEVEGEDEPVIVVRASWHPDVVPEAGSSISLGIFNQFSEMTHPSGAFLQPFDLESMAGRVPVRAFLRRHGEKPVPRGTTFYYSPSEEPVLMVALFMWDLVEGVYDYPKEGRVAVSNTVEVTLGEDVSVRNLGYSARVLW